MKKTTLLFALAINGYLSSLPLSPQINLGTARFSALEGNILQIDVSNQASLDWDSFSIGEEELVKFIQPDSDSCVLNRVIGSSSSEILGKMEANGKVLLINPNGVLFGPNAKLDMNALVVSTFDVANEQFAGFKEIKFHGKSEKTITNLGSIHVDQSLIFSGRVIKNSGKIQAAEHLSFQNHDRIHYDRNSEVLSSGIITCPDIKLSAGTIALNDCTLDASQRNSGGAISIAGTQIQISSSCQLHASAIERGNGGSVTIKADESTYFAGKIFGKGGELGGNGGFAEVSGKKGVDYRGLSFLSSVKGKNGSLLLDPTDIVISSGVGGAPSGCAACASGTCLATPGTCSTFTTGNLDSVALQTQLQTGACDVIIDATGAGAGAGTITHAAGSNISWNTSNSLTYNATGNISIFSQILNNGAAGAAGNIFLRTQSGTIQISSLANTQNVSVGSQNGTTQICAPNADVIVTSPNTGPDRHAQIGFLVPEGANLNCSGPIIVDCRNLSLISSRQSNVAAQIGHGQSGALGGGLTLTTQATATINVTASGNVLLFNSPDGIGAGNQTACRIGHGAQILVGASFLRGDITVIAGGRIDLIARTGAGVGVTIANIGHGETNSGGNPYSVSGNIFVQSGSDINIQYINPYIAAFSTLGIGSNGNSFTAAPGAGVSGNFTILAGQDLNMTGPIANNTLNRMIIGWFGPGNTTNINTIINVNACRDINLVVNDIQSDFFFIGASTANNNFGANNDVQVRAGRDINFTTSAPSGGAIGNSRGRIGNVTGLTGSSNTYVSVGRNINISGSRQLGIQGFGTVAVSAGGDISLTTLGTAATEFAYIGTNRGTLALTNRIYAGGSITATNSAAARAILGRGSLATATYATSLDVRAGGNIQIASPFSLNAGNVVVATTGSIFIEADTILPAGSLLTAAGNQITSICNVGLTTSIPTNPICAVQSSSAITSDLFGGLTFNTGALGGFVTLQTTNQPITLHSAPSLLNGVNTPNLVIGTGNNQAQLITTSGSIDMSGSLCTSGFYNILINTTASPWTTGGNVLARAANEIQVNTPVTTGGAGNTIALVADSDFTGGGNLLINDDVQTNNGNIFLSAAADPNCTNVFLCSGGIIPGIDSSVVQNGGTISSGSGNVSIQASQNIEINGDPVSITATSGSIQTRAGANTFLYRAVSNSAPTGIIEMISGISMFMQGGTISSPNQVVLVVDDNFPSAPLIGDGFFFMDDTSSITASEIRIYTARQQLNTILGQLNLTTFTAGTLYQDTTQEQWSTYFSCTNPFLNIGFPFTIFYKDSLQQLTEQAMVIIDQFLVDLHPYNEFPGWMARFYVLNEFTSEHSKTPYLIRRRNLNIINHPKSWTKFNMEMR